jgi:hypothetical protein
VAGAILSYINIKQKPELNKLNNEIDKLEFIENDIQEY